MKRIATLGFLFVLFCSSILRAEVYTIDFNRGTRSGVSGITKSLTNTTNPQLYCKSGYDLVTLHANTDKCFYHDKGCGIRIGSDMGDGNFILTLGSAALYVSKIIIYASKVEGNTTARLTIKGGSVYTCIVENSGLKEYSAENPISEYYMLPEIIIDKSFVNLQLLAPKQGYVMLHQIDIIFSEDNITLPAQSGDTHYATFSSGQATFFPSDVTVSKVSVNDGHLVVTALETQAGFGTTGSYVPANTGVLLSSSSENASYYTLEGETLTALTDNMLKPASETMTGSGKFYKLAYDDYTNRTGLGFYWGAENGGAFSCKEGTAYLYIPGSSSVKGFVLDDAADEDAIHSPAEYPDETGDIYNVAGQRVSKPLQGIYIRNGRKYVGK